MHVILPGRKHLHAVLFLPATDQLLLFLVTEQHERRRAAGADQVRTHLCQLGSFCFVTWHRRTELFFRAAREVHCQINELDLCWDQRVEIELLSGFGTIGRADGADEIFFLGFSHDFVSFADSRTVDSDRI